MSQELEQETAKKKIQTVIFDLDGTLLNTIEDLTDSVNAVCTQYGYPVYPVETIKSYVGNGIRKLIERAIPQFMNHSVHIIRSIAVLRQDRMTEF